MNEFGDYLCLVMAQTWTSHQTNHVSIDKFGLVSQVHSEINTSIRFRHAVNRQLHAEEVFNLLEAVSFD